jgi:RNA polymerase sigma factor (sigma-70 family)
VTYRNIREAFQYLEKITQLDFENKFYYKKPLSELKRKVKEIQETGLVSGTNKPKRVKGNPLDYDLILKSINQVEPYEKAITKLFNDFSEKYFRFVVFLAKKFINGRLPFSDIIQEGNIGLLKAVKKYNCELGHKFITYAYWWIRQGISRALADQSRTIRIPIHVQQEFRNIKKATQRLKKELWKDPDLKQISQATGKNEKQLNSLFNMFEDPLSLTQELNEGSGSTLSSFNADARAINPARALERATLRDEINYHLGYLSEREAKVIEMRYGLKDGHESTLEEVAKLLQVTRERIRQIEVKALSILKKKGSQRLKPYLNYDYERADCFSTL